jgi:hypothetical protein
MQNILFLILLLLSPVKSFSIDYRYTNSYNTNNQIYSYYFNSNQISYNHYSNYFNSNDLQCISSYKYDSFNNYLSIIKSLPPQSIENYYSKSYNSLKNYLSIIKSSPSQSIENYYSKSYNSFNNYLSIIKSSPSQSIENYYSKSAPTHIATLVPTISPTSVNTISPTLSPIATLSPTSVNTLSPTLLPTLAPSKKQTEMPTIQEVATMSFDTKLTFDNYDSEELDIKSQQAIIIATANSMNISESYIEYIGSTLKTRRLSIFRILGFNIVVTLKTTIPLQNQRVPSSLYEILTTNLINSVNSGLFTSYLITASNTLGINSFANVSILSVQNDDYVIKEPYKPDIKEKETPKIHTTIYIIFGVILSVYLLMYFVWLWKKYLNNIRRLRNLFEGMINTDDITIRIVEN